MGHCFFNYITIQFYFPLVGYFWVCLRLSFTVVLLLFYCYHLALCVMALQRVETINVWRLCLMVDGLNLSNILTTAWLMYMFHVHLRFKNLYNAFKVDFSHF